MSVQYPRFSETPWKRGLTAGLVTDVHGLPVAALIAAMHPAEAAANLDLIESAPKLFFALRAFVEAVEQSGDEAAFAAELEAARAALALAARETLDPRATIGAAA